MVEVLPEDYAGGIGEMLAKPPPANAYEELADLQDRKGTEVKVSAPAGGDEATMALKYGYSQPINQVSRVPQKTFGYMVDGNITDPFEQAAVRGSNAIFSLFFDAPCVNRQGRYAEEEALAERYQKQMIATSAERDKDAPDLNILLHQWSQADSFMLQARVFEEQHGIEAAQKYTVEFKKYREQRDQAEFETSSLPPAENMYFWCKVRQYLINRERAYDLSMRYPTADVTNVKKALEGGDIHDMIPQMPWAFQEGYQLVMGSKMDGEAHRTQLMALVAGQLPQPPMPYPPMGGMMPPWGFPGYGGDMEGGDEEGQPDKRPAMFNIFRKKKNQNNGGQPQNQQQKPQNRRRRNRQSTQR